MAHVVRAMATAAVLAHTPAAPAAALAVAALKPLPQRCAQPSRPPVVPAGAGPSFLN